MNPHSQKKLTNYHRDHRLNSDDSEGQSEGLILEGFNDEGSFFGEYSEYSDLEFIIKAVKKYKYLMLQKPGVYNSQLKKLDFALPVGVKLTVENIESVSSEQMDLTLTFIMTQTWTDKRLAHGGKRKLLVPSKILGQLWIPDLVIQNAKLTDSDSSENFMLKIGSGGEMEYQIKMSSTIICEMALANFPMDRQMCALSLYRK